MGVSSQESYQLPDELSKIELAKNSNILTLFQFTIDSLEGEAEQCKMFLECMNLKKGDFREIFDDMNTLIKNGTEIIAKKIRDGERTPEYPKLKSDKLIRILTDVENKIIEFRALARRAHDNREAISEGRSYSDLWQDIEVDFVKFIRDLTRLYIPRWRSNENLQNLRHSK